MHRRFSLGGKRELNLVCLMPMYQPIKVLLFVFGHCLAMPDLQRFSSLCYDAKIRLILQ